MGTLKKMFLVPPALLERLMSREDSNVNNLSEKMNQELISATSDETADQSLARFRRYQDPYLKLMKEKRKNISIPLIEIPSKMSKIKQVKKQEGKRKRRSKPRDVTPSIPDKMLENKNQEGPSFMTDEDVFESKSIKNDENNSDFPRKELISNDYTDVDDVTSFTTKNFGEIAGKYISAYATKRDNLDGIYGIRKEGNKFKLGDFDVTVQNNDIHVGDSVYKGSEGMWELITKKNVDLSKITKSDLAQYKKVLLQTKAHINKSGRIKSARGKKYTEIISNLFSGSRWTTIN